MADEERRTIVRFPKGETVGAPRAAAPASWKILIVDDEPEVHRITKLVLKDKEVFGRRLEFLDASNAAEGRSLLQAYPGIAVVLLDVVMESEDAGLRLAKWIREELGNQTVRIILRTGQPGHAPEARVIVDYEINDYREKTELTADKLWSAVVNAIRGYRDIKMIQGSRRGMEMILDASPTLFQLQSLKLFASGVLTQLISLFSATQDAAFLDISGFAAQLRPRGVVIAASGKFRASLDTSLDAAIPPRARAIVDQAVRERRPVFEPGIFATCIEGPRGEFGAIYLEGCPTLEDIDLKLVSLFCTNVAAAFSNIKLYEELEARLEEKLTLLEEIHHRVKNNLQIILSLVNLAEADSGLSPAEILRTTKKRIATMTIVHDRLFSSEGEDLIDFAGCVDDIIAEVVSGLGEGLPEVKAEVSSFVIALEKAIPCALLVGELLALGLEAVKALKVEGRELGPLTLSLDGQSGTEYRLSLGIPAASFCLDELSLGAQLIQILAAQLHARVETAERPGSCVTEVVFPKTPASRLG